MQTFEPSLYPNIGWVVLDLSQAWAQKQPREPARGSGWGPLGCLDQHLGASLKVIQSLLAGRQGVNHRFGEAVLDEPVGGASGEHKQLAHALPARLAFHSPQQTLAGSGVAVFGMHRQTNEFPRARVRKRIQSGAADDDAIVLEHEEASDLDLEQLAWSLDQGAIGLERFDKLQNAPDVVNPGRPQLLERVLAHHRAH